MYVFLFYQLKVAFTALIINRLLYIPTEYSSYLQFVFHKCSQTLSLTFPAFLHLLSFLIQFSSYNLSISISLFLLSFPQSLSKLDLSFFHIPPQFSASRRSNFFHLDDYLEHCLVCLFMDNKFLRKASQENGEREEKKGSLF